MLTDSHNELDAEDTWEPPRYLNDVENELQEAIEMRDISIQGSKDLRRRFRELRKESHNLEQAIRLGRRIACGGGCRWSLRTIIARRRPTGDGGRRWLEDRLEVVQGECARVREGRHISALCLKEAKEEIRHLREEWHAKYESYNNERVIFTAEEVAHLAPSIDSPMSMS
ncbi:hypothetical protein AAF712_009618 [Marasmius tenuissimus]|uniref:Uncharacterized protein n=1 Tax=Marasmius tenuissimus TaxID=585030 RepID=A0ABR2ZPL5_9AGAR